MAALATYVDCETRWNATLTGSEINQVEALLTDASALILDVAALTTDWTAATLPASVLPVVCEVARRAFDNPAGLDGETIGDYTWRSGYRGIGGSLLSGVYLTPQEQRIVRRAASKLGIGTMTLSGDLPIAPADPRLGVLSLYTDADGVVIVNAAEPEDL